MIKSLPDSLTINESIAVLMGIESLPIGKTVTEYLDDIHEDSAVEYAISLDNAEPESLRETLNRRMSASAHNAQLAHSIRKALEHEIKNLSDDSKLKLTQNSNRESRIITQSLLQWAEKVLGKVVPTQKTVDDIPPRRRYKSTLFDILEAAAATHWDGVEIKPDVPKNEVIILWMRTHYPEVEFSNKTLESICTIIRPDEFK